MTSCEIELRDLSGVRLNVAQLRSLSLLRSFSLLLTNPLNRNSTTLHFSPTRQLLADHAHRPPHSECFFEAVSDAGEHSALNLCPDSDLSGLLRLHGRAFHFDARDQRFRLSPVESGDCLWSSSAVLPRARRANRLAASDDDVIPTVPDYYASYLDGKWRYVELALIADHSMFLKYNKSEEKVRDRLTSVANIVNSIYHPLNMRISLVWTNIWRDADLISVSSHADRTLGGFLEHRRTLIKDHPHDNAHLVTDIRFDNGVVGKAYKGTMCSYDYSGGVDVDHNEHAGAVAATIAHEMGHNLGMEHDDFDLCRCAAPNHGCIMAASTGLHLPRLWSDCSLNVLQQNLARGVDVCLKNSPEIARGDAKCGNGIVETGEECDCGAKEYCTNRCCDWKTCRLAANAECASGDCCDVKTCKPHKAAIVCRPATGQCDLAEYCDGHSEFCPADFYVQDGLACPTNRDGLCYNGQCGSRDGQCRLIWGATARNADMNCYKSNELGTPHGNCGYEPDTNKYLACASEDAQCGRLHCEHSAERTELGQPSLVYTAQSHIRRADGSFGQCNVVRLTFTGEKTKQRDPGMVPDGTPCGRDRFCLNTKCVNESETLKMVSQCDPGDCHNLGVCNNAGNCHCLVGYGGTDCAIPGRGGSVNSGPASADGIFNAAVVLLWILLAVIVVFAALSIYVKRKRNFWMWARMKRDLKLHGVLVPVRRAPPPPRAARTPRDLDQVWGEESPNTLHATRPPIPSFAPPSLPASATIWDGNSRPRKAPPNVPQRPDKATLEQLYVGDERTPSLYEEVMRVFGGGARRASPPSPPPPDDPRPVGIVRKQSTNRPTGKPPPPPKHGVQVPVSDGRSAKPAVPQKPSLDAGTTKPVSVKMLAARFDAKSSQVSTDIC